ncbi:hypothetical protein [Phocicoccus pinnipedialis]|nr:hypothetical protein [Jeotgalicoccus pinnipedialis]
MAMRPGVSVTSRFSDNHARSHFYQGLASHYVNEKRPQLSPTL